MPYISSFLESHHQRNIFVVAKKGKIFCVCCVWGDDNIYAYNGKIWSEKSEKWYRMALLCVCEFYFASLFPRVPPLYRTHPSGHSHVPSKAKHKNMCINL